MPTILDSPASAPYRVSDFFSQHIPVGTQPLVSVITPVYNGEEFLKDCIESVIGQTYENWEYTIVNNCSTDRTFEIAQSYAARDSRIHVHNNQQFLPIIQNHNHAIRQISPSSKYCKVVLADDWISPDCLMKMVALAEDNPSVGIVGAYGLLGDGIHVIWRGIPFPRFVVPGKEICRQRLLTGTYVFGAPTATLIRSDFIRKRETFYDESHLHADSTACFRILQDADFGFVHQILTFTRTQNESNATFTDRMNSLHLCNLMELREYGLLCLNEQEYRDRLASRLTQYYQVLAEGLLQRRGRAYWEYHRSALRQLGIPLSPLALSLGFCRAAWHGLSHPVQAFQSVRRWWLAAGARKVRTQTALAANR
jgi:glycosyltransferase involved in cell wall biosynthesis